MQNNWFSSYCQKCQDGFLRQCIVATTTNITLRPNKKHPRYLHL